MKAEESPYISIIKRDLKTSNFMSTDDIYYGFITYVDDKNNLFTRKIFIDEIVDVYISITETHIESLASISFYHNKIYKNILQYFFNKIFFTRKIELVSLNNDYFDNSLFKIYAPKDKINIDYIGATPEESISLYLIKKEKDGFVDYNRVFSRKYISKIIHDS